MDPDVKVNEEIGRAARSVLNGAGIQDVLNSRRILALDQSFGDGDVEQS